MGSEKIIITRKIQLSIDSSEKEIKDASYRTLFDWRYICYRAANLISSHAYMQYQLKDFFYLVEETKVKLSKYVQGKEGEGDKEGILTTSFLNTTYQVLSKQFKGTIPMIILAALNKSIRSQIEKERGAIVRGERSVRNYKNKIPIPIPPSLIANISYCSEKRNYKFNIQDIPFITYFGRDNNNTKIIWERSLEGEYKLCESQLIIDKKKLFLLAAFQFEKNHCTLDEKIVAEAHLAIDIPIIVKIGKYKYDIGNKEEYLYRRVAIQNARRRCQKGAINNRPQHGRNRKLKPLINYNEKEKNYVNTKLHTYAKSLVDLCAKHNVGSLILVDQSEKETVAKEDTFLLRNWGYGDLKQKISYKANIIGLKIISE